VIEPAKFNNVVSFLWAIADLLNGAFQKSEFQKIILSFTSTFRKRAASGLQSGRNFVLPHAKEQAHEKTDLELVTWLVIKENTI